MKGIKKIILLLVMLLPLTLTLGVLSAFADGMQQGGQAQTTDRTFAFTQEELDGKTFLFFGDSITAGYGLSATELDYVEILSDEFGFEAHNKAVSGGKTEMFIDFLGDKGGARLSYCGQFTFWNGATLESYTSEHEIPDMYKEENEAFLKSIDTGVKDKNHIDNVLESARLLQALYDSSEQNKEIQL